MTHRVDQSGIFRSENRGPILDPAAVGIPGISDFVDLDGGHGRRGRQEEKNGNERAFLSFLMTTLFGFSSAFSA
jgi:hypothetical protein